MRRSAVTATVLASLAMPAAAQEDCSRSLMPDKVNFTSSEIVRLSLAWSLSESAYNETKRKSGITVPIYGVPVGANHDEYKNNVKQRAERYKFDNFEQRAFAYSSTALGEKALHAYRACLAARGGTSLVLGLMSPRLYSIWLTYLPHVDPAPGLRGRVLGTTNIDNASMAKLKSIVEDIRSEARADHNVTIVANDPNSEASVDVAIGRQSRTLPLPPLTPPPPAPPKCNATRVNLRGGEASLGDGVEVKNLYYRHIGPSRHTHEFKFDVYVSSRRVRAGATYVGDNGEKPSGQNSVEFDGRTLEYGFARYNNGVGWLHYCLR